MKTIKLLFIILALGLIAISFVACGEKNEPESPEQNQEQTQEVENKTVEEEEKERIANPIVEYDSVEDAVIVVGHLSPLPSIYEKYFKKVSVISNSMIQIVYSDDESEKLVLREQAGTEADISGVYDTYSYNSTIQSNENKVTVKGASEDSINVVIWNDGAYSHSLYYENGASLEEVTDVVNEING